MGAIQFWLSQGKERLQLPVNPESVSVTSPYGFQDVNVAQLGEVTIFGQRGQREFSLSSFFPSVYNAVYCEYSKIPKPNDVIKKLEKWRDTKKPIKFTVTGTLISFDVTIRELTYDPEKAGNPGDIYYSLTLKEYRRPTVKKTNKKSSSTSSKVRPSASKSKTKTYTVKSGDCLWKIAARKDVYGSGSKWQKIYTANKKVIGSNPNLIRPGQKLVIP